MKRIIHRASDRIVNDLGWLRISASFRDESESADRKRFGTLIILDDALMIPGGRGFKLHPHDNMEIISWVLSGTDEHNDSQNGITLLRSGDVQLMSAGTGIEHAENNPSTTEAVHMFQIWIEPGQKNILPRYQVKTLPSISKGSELITFITPDGADDSLVINQQAYLSHISLEPGKKFQYKINVSENGVYLFLMSGNIHLDGTDLFARDAMAVYPGGRIEVEAMQLSNILFIEIPMR